MRMAIKDGKIYLIEFDSTQYGIMRSWGALRYVRAKQWMEGAVSLELLDKLAGITTLPPKAAELRKKLADTQKAIDILRTEEDPKPLVKFPVKGSLYKHQIRAADMALVEFGLVDPSEVLSKEKKRKEMPE